MFFFVVHCQKKKKICESSTFPPPPLFFFSSYYDTAVDFEFFKTYFTSLLKLITLDIRYGNCFLVFLQKILWFFLLPFFYHQLLRSMMSSLSNFEAKKFFSCFKLFLSSVFLCGEYTARPQAAVLDGSPSFADVVKLPSLLLISSNSLVTSPAALEGRCEILCWMMD